MSKDKGIKNIKKLPSDKKVTKVLSEYQASKKGVITLTPFVEKVKK